jgi:chromosome segregation ATPase
MCFLSTAVGAGNQFHVLEVAMDLSEQAGAEVNLEGYKTPLTKLARRFKASVELWKQKYHQLKREIKRFQNRAADAQRSRDHWKQQAQQWQASAQQLQAEVDRLCAESAGPKNKLSQRS